MAELLLPKGRICLIDDSDFAELSHWKWKVSPNGYVMRCSGKNTSELIHRRLMKPPKGFEVDHINRNKLDNRRFNLRVVPHSINERNKPARQGSLSGRRGVTYDKSRGKWAARAGHKRKTVNLGRFDSVEDAELAYLNFVRKIESEVMAASRSETK